MRKRNSAQSQSSSRPSTRWPLDRILIVTIACTVFLTVVAIRIRLLGIPLERDEGEYAYTGQLMLQGIPPYKLAYSMKFPGTAAYALIMSIFGQTITGIHLGLILVNAATVVLVFFLGQRLLGPKTGYAAAASYAVLSLSPSLLGLASHATHFVVLPVLAGILLLLNASNRGAFPRIFVSGLLFGLGLLMKQPAIFLILFGALYLLLRDIRDRLGARTILLRSLTFGAGVMLPFAITCLVLWWSGVFSRFWFWTIEYARQYAGETPLSEARRELIPDVTGAIGANWPLWALAAVGLLALWAKRTRASVPFLTGFLLLSMLAVSYRLYLRNHYFILMLPAVSLLAGVAFGQLYSFMTRFPSPARLAPVLLLGAALTWPIYQARNIFFYLSPIEICQTLYSGNPFVESIRIAQYLHDQTSPSDQIAVLGSEPEIYFYAHRHSATGYIYTYGLVEGQPYAVQMQREMVNEIEHARPQFFVVVGIGASWLSKPGVQHPVFNWITDYTRQNYDLVGFVNMLAPGRTDYYFDNLPKSLPEIGNRIFIDRKKS